MFTVRAVRRWNRLPGEVVGAPCLSVLEGRVDDALSNVPRIWVALKWSGGWTGSLEVLSI